MIWDLFFQIYNKNLIAIFYKKENDWFECDLKFMSKIFKPKKEKRLNSSYIIRKA